jgi:hypothetical protein
MTGGALLRWWRRLWASGAATTAASAPPTDSRPSHGGAGGIEAEPVAGRTRRHYTAPPADDDPQREAHLGAVLQALAGGPLSRAELGSRVGAADWGSGSLDAVVAHGVATGVLVATADGGVRARYAD